MPNKNILYINPIGPDIQWGIIHNNACIVYKTEIMQDVSVDFPHLLHTIYQEYSFDEIWCIHGPWAFTRIRIISLTINAFWYIHHDIILREAHIFDIIPKEYIPILEINSRECLIQNNLGIHNTSIASLTKGNYCGYLYSIPENPDITYTPLLFSLNDIQNIFHKVPPVPLITPIYFKNPHITCPKTP